MHLWSVPARPSLPRPRLSTSVALPQVQVVTHLCYSDFQDIMTAVDDMDGEGSGERKGGRMKLSQRQPLDLPAGLLRLPKLCMPWTVHPCDTTHLVLTPRPLSSPPFAPLPLCAPCLRRPTADVLTIENSRSGDAMVSALAAAGYSKDLGPGVYDVHSPQVRPEGGAGACCCCLFSRLTLAARRWWLCRNTFGLHTDASVWLF